MAFVRRFIRQWKRVSLLLLFLSLAYAGVVHAVQVGPTFSGDNSPFSLKTTLDAVTNSVINNDTSLDSYIAGSADTTVDGKRGGNGFFVSTINAAILGLGGQNKKVAMNVNGEMKTVTVYAPGAVGSISNLTAQLYQHPPASSVEYIADLIQNIKHPFVQPAYAQGLGFSSLNPVLGVWKILRNVAYFFFVIMFVVVGFMIMLRSKIGSQAAVTVQQALPQLVIALILVTFSYAIAGLMIDLMYLVIYLIIGIFGNNVAGHDLTDLAFNKDIFANGIGLVTGNVAGTIASSMNQITQSILLNLGWVDQTAQIAGFAVNVIFVLVLIVAIFVSLFRVFFALLQAYVGIFFSVIFAPIQLMIGALPGQNTFGKWITGLLENLMVFPTIILLIIVAYYFSTGNQQATFDKENAGFSAPQLGSNQIGGFATYQALIALGAILAMPEVLKVTKGIMKGEAGIDLNTLGKNLQAGVPLGTRVGLAGGAALGAGGLEFGRDLISSRGRDWRGAATKARVAAIGGKNPVTGKMEAGAAARGITAASFISRGLGANQPDILNPITGAIDKRLNPEVKAREERLQEIEDALDRLRKSQPGGSK